MATWRIATGAEQPINRVGGEAQYAGEEGELVGLNDNAGNPEVAQADADSGVAQPAFGVLLAPVDDLSTYSTELDSLAQRMATEMHTVLGDRVAVVTHGVIVEDTEETAAFTIGEPVYLAVGGGVTQTKPSTTGEVQQRVGVAVEENAFFLDVDFEYATA